jgi:hypothetical protein
MGRLDRKNKEVTARLATYLFEPYRGVRFAAISALGERGDADAFARLETPVKSGELGQGLEESARSILARLKKSTEEKK